MIRMAKTSVATAKPMSPLTRNDAQAAIPARLAKIIVLSGAEAISAAEPTISIAVSVHNA